MRYPAVAGSFYTSSASQLRAEVKGYLDAASRKVEKKERLAIVCPHAGYAYSGATAAYSYASAANFSQPGITAIVIGPNHTGAGTPISISREGWKTPLGILRCDTELVDAIIAEGKIARRDETAHASEHSCEVQLPFLQMCALDARIVCICMAWQDEKSTEDLAKAIFATARKLKRNAIVIASSDFTHYESAESARKKDEGAISLLEKMDAVGFESLIDARDLSICGHGPIACALIYGALAGAKKCELLSYTHSSVVTGEGGEGVAYASLAIS
ncbi:MAG: AmmeMemoRadiSam system protein B [Candidatus Micrarchaeota archaeon]|nr:AmmeMemoRadiSam system protein B [Candidatus Micrarchaeota archaeon]